MRATTRLAFALTAGLSLLSLTACGGGGSMPGEGEAGTGETVQAPAAPSEVATSQAQAPVQLHAPVQASIGPQLPPPQVATGIEVAR